VRAYRSRNVSRECGDAQDPMQLYIAFRGRPPSTAALLRSRNLTTEQRRQVDVQPPP
jgi:Zn-dependent oligopeptidase